MTDGIWVNVVREPVVSGILMRDDQFSGGGFRAAFLSSPAVGCDGNLLALAQPPRVK